MRIPDEQIATLIRQTAPQFLDRGWYPTGSMTKGNLAKLASASAEDVAFDNVMIRIARQNLGRSKDVLQASWPHRASILADAFWAHDQGKYKLSIPVFLAQADGIGAEAFDITLGSSLLLTRQSKEPHEEWHRRHGSSRNHWRDL